MAIRAENLDGRLITSVLHHPGNDDVAGTSLVPAIGIDMIKLQHVGV